MARKTYVICDWCGRQWKEDDPGAQKFRRSYWRVAHDGKHTAIFDADLCDSCSEAFNEHIRRVEHECRKGLWKPQTVVRPSVHTMDPKQGSTTVPGPLPANVEATKWTDDEFRKVRDQNKIRDLEREASEQFDVLEEMRAILRRCVLALGVCKDRIIRDRPGKSATAPEVLTALEAIESAAGWWEAGGDDPQQQTETSEPDRDPELPSYPSPVETSLRDQVLVLEREVRKERHAKQEGRRALRRCVYALSLCTNAMSAWKQKYPGEPEPPEMVPALEAMVIAEGCQVELTKDQVAEPEHKEK